MSQSARVVSRPTVVAACLLVAACYVTACYVTACYITAGSDLDSLTSGSAVVAPDGASLPDATLPDATLPDSAIPADGGGPLGDTFTAAVLADAPVDYFRFEEPSAAACANTGSGTSTCLYGSPGLTRAVAGSGSARKGVRFDSASALITLFGAVPYAGAQPLTVEIVISVETATGTVFEQLDYAPSRTGQNLFIDSASRLRTETWSAGTHIFYTYSPTSPTPNTWYHLAYGFDPVANRDFLYVNGGPVEASRIATGSRIKPITDFKLGGCVMTIDDLAVYDKMLPSARIAAH